MLRILAALVLAGLVSTAIHVAVAADPAKPNDVEGLMQRKLRHSQQILAGLATENYEAIATHARALNELTNEQWTKEDSTDYRAQLKVFRFTNTELIRLAEEKNLHGATLAYMQQTLSCVSCHQHLRGKAR